MLPIQLKHVIGIIVLLFGGFMIVGQGVDGYETAMTVKKTASNDFKLMPRANAPEECACITNGYHKETLSFHERDALFYMREEEKLTRDVYLQLYEMWDAQPFENMRQVEERHMAALLCLINKYALKDPVGERPVGIYKSPDLTILYKILIKKGSQSLTDAYAVGAMLEVWDMSDKIEFEKDFNNQDLIAVVAELKRSTRNHIRSMELNLQEFGMTFTPVSIAPKVYKNVVKSDVERDGKICSNMKLCITAGANLDAHRPCKVVANRKNSN